MAAHIPDAFMVDDRHSLCDPLDVDEVLNDGNPIYHIIHINNFLFSCLDVPNGKVMSAFS